MFEEQDAAYRTSVLGGEGVLRVGVEAAVRQGWDRYIGADGPFVGMTGFGASAPPKVLFEHFGFTPENVAETVRKALR